MSAIGRIAHAPLTHHGAGVLTIHPSIHAGLHLILGGAGAPPLEALLLFVVPLVRVGGFALALEIIWVVIDAIPALIRTAFRIGLPVEISAFLIVHDLAAQVPMARRDDRGALQGDVPLQGVLDVLAGRRPDGLHVGIMDSFEGRVLLVEVVRCQRSIVRATMVIGTPNGVKVVDGVRGWDMTTSANVRRATSHAMLTSERLKWSVRHISGIALINGAITAETVGLAGLVGDLTAQSAVV